MKRYAIIITIALCALLPATSKADPKTKKTTTTSASSFPRPGEPRSPLPDDIVIAAQENRKVLPEPQAKLGRLAANAASVFDTSAQVSLPAFFFTDTVAAYKKAVAEDKLLITVLGDSNSEYTRRLLSELATNQSFTKLQNCAVFLSGNIVTDTEAKKIADSVNVTRVPVTTILMPKLEVINEHAQIVGYFESNEFVQYVKDEILSAALDPNAPASLRANPLQVCPALGSLPAKY